jgi:hypothetical protein
MYVGNRNCLVNLTCPSVETASIKAVVTVGVNAPLTSGNETGITKATAGLFME